VCVELLTTKRHRRKKEKTKKSTTTNKKKEGKNRNAKKAPLRTLSFIVLFSRHFFLSMARLECCVARKS